MIYYERPLIYISITKLQNLNIFLKIQTVTKIFNLSLVYFICIIHKKVLTTGKREWANL